VIAWESHYQLAEELLENGFKIINASWQPTYLVDSLSKRWGPEDLLNWNVYNWQHWWPHSVAHLNPINIQPTDKLLGATMCSWGLTYDQHISRLLENFPAFAERTWTVERKLSWAEYKDVFRKILRRAAWLVQDK
jgi:hexosaminidase